MMVFIELQWLLALFFLSRKGKKLRRPVCRVTRAAKNVFFVENQCDRVLS